MKIRALIKKHSEEEIINGCQKGLDKYREMLYKQYYGFGMSVCLRYTANREDATELLNDSFMKVFQNIESYQADKPFKAWFRRIMVNTCISFFRSNINKQQFYHIEGEVEEGNDVSCLPASNLEAKDILLLLNSLPDHFRLVFNLYEVEGFSHEEIGAMMDISPGTSRSNLSRAKKMLRSLYSKQFGVQLNCGATIQ
ncbi:MAG: RNA polymerase sigma factor [Bacteroidales bacterium]|nr:RNA polymerase sigma factor [Bacteroidales bacterium]